MKYDLPEDIISAEDLKGVIEELKDYQTYARHGSIKARVTKRAGGTKPELSRPSNELINLIVNNNKLALSDLDRLISSLEKMYSALPRIKITLAALPGAGIKKQMSVWVRKNITSNVLIDFSYNQSLLGGMVVVAGSHIYDWSLRKQIISVQPKLNELIANHV